jgi:hypothetical protein
MRLLGQVSILRRGLCRQPQIEISNSSFDFTGRQRFRLLALIERKENVMPEFGEIRDRASPAGCR